MKLLVATRADKDFSELTRITHPILQGYASKCGADFMVLEEPMTDASSDRNNKHYRIMHQKELHQEYDRILHLDSDLLVTPDCPSLFNIVPQDKIGTIYEDKGSRRVDRASRIYSAQVKWGDIGWREGYINTSVFLTSRQHADIFQKQQGEYWEDNGVDDVLLGYNIVQQKHQVFELPYQYNHMSMFSEAWNGHADRKKSHIIHYAGKPLETRMQMLREDYDYFFTRPITLESLYDDC